MIEISEKFLLSDEQLIFLLKEDDQGGSQIEAIFAQLIERSPIISPIEVARILSTILGLDKKGADQIREKLINLIKKWLDLTYTKEQIRNGVCFYFDVDNTVYITSKLKEAIIPVLVSTFQKYGFSEVEIKESYASYYQQFGSRSFLPEQCVARMESDLNVKRKKLNKRDGVKHFEFSLSDSDKKTLMQALYSLPNNSDFVDPEAISMLQALQAKFADGDRLVAYTNGHRAWQEPKVAAITTAMGLRRRTLDALIALDKTTDPIVPSHLTDRSCILDDQIGNLLKLAENKKGSALKMFWYNPTAQPAPSEALEKARRLKLKVIEIHSIREMEEYLL